MMLIYISIMLGILHGARGSGESFFTSKGCIGIYVGILMVILTGDIYNFSVGLCYYLAVLLGWGKGFATIHGNYAEEEDEIAPIDIITDSWFIKNNYLNGILWMSLRGLLFLPMFWGNLLYGIPVILMGIIYYIAGKINNGTDRNPVRLAECLLGGLIGILLFITYL